VENNIIAKKLTNSKVGLPIPAGRAGITHR